MVILFVVIVYTAIFFMDFLPNIKKKSNIGFKLLHIFSFSFSLIVLILQIIGINLFRPYAFLEQFLI